MVFSGYPPLISTIGVLPTNYPALGFVIGCTVNFFVIICQLLTNTNPVFNIGACGCNGVGCPSDATTVNNITFLITACKIELYETIKYNGHNVVQYSALSELQLTINTNTFKSPKYIISQFNTVLFEAYLCRKFDYDETHFPPAISNLDYTKCAPIGDTSQQFGDASNLQTYMNEACQLLLFLPQTVKKMIIADKVYLPLAVNLAAPSRTSFLISTGGYNTVTVNQPSTNSSQTCTVRYSTQESSGLYVSTFGNMCNPEVIPSGALASISASGSAPRETANLCNGDGLNCISQCKPFMGCSEPNVVPNPSESIVDGLVGTVTSIKAPLPSLSTQANPIGALSNYLNTANGFLP